MTDLPSVLWRAYDQLEFAEFFVRHGKVRLRALSYYKLIESEARRDTSEGDGHTSLSGWMEGDAWVPLRMRWFSDGLFVVRVGSGHEDMYAGEVLRIGASETDSAVNVVSGLISADNEPYRRRRSARLLSNASLLHQLGLVSQPDSAVFTIRTPEGDTVDVSLAAVVDEIEWAEVNTGEVPLFRQRREEPYWYEVLWEARTVYFKYNQCVSRKQFRDFSKRLKNVIATEEIDRMVVDFRGNGGGNSALFSFYLLGFLRRNADLNQEGHLYSVIDGGTFSSAVLNSIALERETQAITIGESTGGKPNHFGEVKTFTLPNSGLVVRYSTKHFEPYPQLGDAPSFQPEIAIPLSSSDYFGGKDPVLDRILGTPVNGAP